MTYVIFLIFGITTNVTAIPNHPVQCLQWLISLSLSATSPVKMQNQSNSTTNQAAYILEGYERLIVSGVVTIQPTR